MAHSPARNRVLGTIGGHTCGLLSAPIMGCPARQENCPEELAKPVSTPVRTGVTAHLLPPRGNIAVSPARPAKRLFSLPLEIRAKQRGWGVIKARLETGSAAQI